MLFAMLDVMQQLVTRIDDDMAEALDRLVATGAVASRSEAVRRGLQILLDQHRRHVIASEIVEGYRARPQGERELGWSDEATRRMITEEPW
jgi:Arc/MetJ-type ribon-helix-helix transcriptional regulator